MNCGTVRGAMTEVTPFGMREIFGNKYPKRHEKQVSQRKKTKK
jgi:hypothetical protein